MIITNKHNIVEPIFNAVKAVYPPKPNRLSVTRLIDSPLIAQLLEKHWDKLEEDCIDRLWALLGQALDKILTENAPKHWITQEKMEVVVDGITVVGKADYYDPETGILGDWKSTSVWSFVFGGRKEWEKQLNCYAWLERKLGRNVKKLVAQRLFRDFMKRKAGEDGYPDLPFMEIEIPLWPYEQQEEYIADQIHYHTIEKSPICNPDEKWEKPTTYAVIKRGRKSALRVLESEYVANKWCNENSHTQVITDPDGVHKRLATGISIVERKGECTRCKSYCPVRAVCPNNPYKELKKKEK